MTLTPHHVWAGDDFFSIRAFAKLNEATLAMEDEDLKKVTATGGLDDDYIEYVINAPVDIDGVCTGRLKEEESHCQSCNGR